MDDEVDVDLAGSVVADRVRAHLRRLDALLVVPAAAGDEGEARFEVCLVGEEEAHVLVADARRGVVEQVVATQRDADHPRPELLHPGHDGAVDALLVLGRFSFGCGAVGHSAPPTPLPSMAELSMGTNSSIAHGMERGVGAFVAIARGSLSRKR